MACFYMPFFYLLLLQPPYSHSDMYPFAQTRADAHSHTEHLGHFSTHVLRKNLIHGHPALPTGPQWDQLSISREGVVPGNVTGILLKLRRSTGLSAAASPSCSPLFSCWTTQGTGGTEGDENTIAFWINTLFSELCSPGGPGEVSRDANIKVLEAIYPLYLLSLYRDCLDFLKSTTIYLFFEV